ncbi:MAG: copper chaperone PCu(A)C [Ilumatobacteraceae bacterium]
MKTTLKRSTVALLVVISMTGLAACGSDDSTTDTTVAAEDTTPATPNITISSQWARTSPMATDMGAAYMTINSDADDELVSASVDMSIAMMTQVHEMVMGDDGAMKMQEVEKIVIKAGTPTELKPGGYHVMLMGLKAPLETGSTISVTLTFARAGEVVVEVPVQEEAP